jgi:uncharacterized protein (DUF885 family)
MFAVACAGSGSPALHSPELVTSPKSAAPAPAADRWEPQDAAAGVSDGELASLLVDHWKSTLERAPVWATRLGVRRFDDRIGDASYDAVLAHRKLTRGFLERARSIDAARLGAADRVTHGLFVEQLESDVASEVCEFALWSLSPRSNPVTVWNHLPEDHSVDSVRDGDNLLARYRAIGRAIDQERENLLLGAKRGLFANAHSARIVAEMVKKQLGEPLTGWPLLEPVKKPRSSWPAEAQRRFATGLADAVKNGIRPALERYLKTLETEILPRARGADREGIGALPNGKACYAALVRAHTTLPVSPADAHQTGLEEVARIDREIAALGAKLFSEPKLAKVLERLRSDKKLYFASEAEIVSAAETALGKAKAAMPRYFGILPKADCVVRRMPDYEAPYSTIAYYRQPNPDGSKPGEYMVNVLAPETRPRFEAEVLAFHESIPGHHLQIAIAQERSALPAFRRHDGMTAFVEGWALYTERLSEEMGLYSGDLDRMGMLSFDAWRATRLVVDTGIHSLGWTREQAQRYMLEHTALTPKNIENEVDRYIVWPGQALAYKLGQLAVSKLRRRAESELGKTFDLAAFHDAVLAEGAVSLPVLEGQIDAWIAARK